MWNMIVRDISTGAVGDKSLLVSASAMGEHTSLGTEDGAGGASVSMSVSAGDGINVADGATDLLTVCCVLLPTRQSRM